MVPSLTVTCIEDRAQLRALESEWEGLLARTDVASPFLIPGWQFAWLETYGKQRRIFVLIARDGGELVGLWPLGIRRRGLFRVLEPLGAGRSDWLDVPVLPSHRNVVLSAFLGYLASHRGKWDLLDLRDILADSPTVGALAPLCDEQRIRLRQQPRTISPYLSLAGTWEQFLQSKRPKFRSNLKYYRRLPEREGHTLEIRRVPWIDADDPVAVLGAIERRSWKAREGNLKVSTPLGAEFYRRFCRYLATKGLLEIWRADFDGAPMAFVLNIVHGGKVYHYNTCYDEQVANFSPGLLLHSEAISDAFERRLSEYDFLSGDEPYKERWCSDRRSIVHLALSHRGVGSSAAHAALIEARWRLRRSERLVRNRQKLLAVARRIGRRAKPGDSSS
jgi:CelD/BcsL family acetyltransferase involved in cellulose biosynthesis